ncbi:IclR family transcriptional regulator [Deinococcus petrolearius]|uniref:IclR family transcriptional regulator n=1 Tax=Deinococcus petrolearius TaxID=1751295 RepID=A0ABW1DKI6_9DEIO
MLGTFEKARAVLDLYTTEHPEWGVTEVARTLGMPTSSTHVLMASLTQMGLLHRTVAGRYRLGFKLLALSQVLLSNTPWREVAEEEMAALFARYGETLSLVAFDGGQIVTVAKFDGRRPGSLRMPNVGSVLPTYQGASGRLLLAHRPWPVVRHVLNDPRVSGLSAGGVPEALRTLEQVLREGAATYEDAGAWSVAAPVRNHNGEVIAALGFSVPLERGPEQRLALLQAVLTTGARISGRIGHVPGLPDDDRMVWMSVGGQERLRTAPRRGRRQG